MSERVFGRPQAQIAAGIVLGFAVLVLGTLGSPTLAAISLLGPLAGLAAGGPERCHFGSGGAWPVTARPAEAGVVDPQACRRGRSRSPRWPSRSLDP